MSKILLVEDEISISRLYSIKLTAANYECKVAGNGLEALKSLDEFIPDLVLLDLGMPVMNGEQFLSIFRKNTNHSETPVLILTNLNKSEAPKTLWHFGISGYVVKVHTTPAELIELIQKTIG